jgi:hypothetical protein
MARIQFSVYTRWTKLDIIISSDPALNLKIVAFAAGPTRIIDNAVGVERTTIYHECQTRRIITTTIRSGKMDNTQSRTHKLEVGGPHCKIIAVQARRTLNVQDVPQQR